MEGKVVRRVIGADNNCLFTAVGYVMEHDKSKAKRLRQVVAEKVRGDPKQYDEAFLGKSNEEYSQWILNLEKWGGAIELSILSSFYHREIAAFDVQTTRCDVYGQAMGYSERVMLIYDGLHYDALALSLFDGAPEDIDQTIFPTSGSEAGEVTRMAQQITHEAKRARKFTDTQNFTLRCGVCQKGVVGQKSSQEVFVQEAVEHAQSTGHTNFQEFR